MITFSVSKVFCPADEGAGVCWSRYEANAYSLLSVNKQPPFIADSFGGQHIQPAFLTKNFARKKDFLLKIMTLCLPVILACWWQYISIISCGESSFSSIVVSLVEDRAFFTCCGQNNPFLDAPTGSFKKIWLIAFASYEEPLHAVTMGLHCGILKIIVIFIMCSIPTDTQDILFA